ncbi:hypothetical protein [Larsenimonas suaedae]|uniref:Uncharacterized protein n=1 Tax=Larsenimonas suaedae TaxID=1851019 RepID=A0ABU1GZM1_9GAMM|nr:hypothetical protein [Larsenimonas suaedae]MCM2973771.1 hypothetical protein [Larsenimonas suaedae]MDR5897295.1 hypothetical protein [Larsenimonas suaedae]
MYNRRFETAPDPNQYRAEAAHIMLRRRQLEQREHLPSNHPDALEEDEYDQLENLRAWEP